MTEIPLESMFKKPLAHQDSYVRFLESARLEWPKKMGEWSQFLSAHVVPCCAQLWFTVMVVLC